MKQKNNMYDDCSTTAATCYLDSTINLEKLKQISNYLDDLAKEFTLFIWEGNLWSSINKPIIPVLKCSDLIDENDGYIFAGTGIVAGKNMYQYIKDFGFVLKWSKKYIPLEEQISFKNSKLKIPKKE